MRKRQMVGFFRLAALCTAICLAQTLPEISTQDKTVTFQSRVTLIEVPVVVRDNSGKVVGTLRREDFQLFDKGRAQVISRFSIEKSGGQRMAVLSAPEAELTPEEKAAPIAASTVIAPDHFVVFAFDDINTEFGNLSVSRTAAQKFIASGLRPADRTAVITTSGQTTLDFTDNRDSLNQTLLKLVPRPVEPPSGCPSMSYAEAYRIADLGDSIVRRRKVAEALNCTNGNVLAAEALVDTQSRMVNGISEYQVERVFRALESAIRRMAQMPGQRTLILASPGFIRPIARLQAESSLIDLAIRLGVVINTLDVRGLYTTSPKAETKNSLLDERSVFVQSDILAELAAGTGGKFIQNTDEIEKVFAELGSAPEVYYLLGFSPQSVKLDGAFHSLKIKVNAMPGSSIQARLGYYAPTHLVSADEDVKEEVADAVFSRTEIRNIPLEVNTRFLKMSEAEAKLTIVSRVDAAKLHFRKADGRSVNDLLLVCALFDRNGNYLQGVSKTIRLRLLDETLRSKLDHGISVRSDFNIAPGTYVFRVVVRDSEGQAMATENGAVEIP
jgi:VWFA-related protein